MSSPGTVAWAMPGVSPRKLGWKGSGCAVWRRPFFMLQLYGKKGLLKTGAGQHRSAGEWAAGADFVSWDNFLGLEKKGKIWCRKRCSREQRLWDMRYLAVCVGQQCVVWHRHAEMGLGCSGIPDKEQRAVVLLPRFCRWNALWQATPGLLCFPFSKSVSVQGCAFGRLCLGHPGQRGLGGHWSSCLRLNPWLVLVWQPGWWPVSSS